MISDATTETPARTEPTIANLEVVASELEQIRKGAGGMLSPADVVTFAERNKRSELHKHFTWDDSEAAKEWRLEEARRLIVRVHVIMPQQTEPTRYYVSLSTDRKLGDGYRALPDVLNNGQRIAVLMEDALRELESVRRRYQQVEQLAQVWTAIAAVAATRRGKKR